MKKLVSWSAWSITTKILTIFLGLSIISMSVIGAISIIEIRHMGNYALQTSSSLGERAIKDSTAHLNKMGEYIIQQKALDIAKQIEMYLSIHPTMTLAEMRSDEELREIVVQPVGTTGYTTLIDPHTMTIIIHKFPEQEKNLITLKEILPSFWALLEYSAGGVITSGYYDWLEVDGSINQKYASIVPINNSNGDLLTLWATTYINEFSLPAEQTKEEISAAILDSSNYIIDNVSNIQDLIAVLFTTLVIIVFGLSLVLSRVITRPIQTLNRGAKAIGQGNLNYRLEINSKDELGDLAKSFNHMSTALFTYTEELKKNAAENITKERNIQENLRLFLQKVTEAQEGERKRIARELHDETLQALVAVERQLDDLDSGNSKLSVQYIRQNVQEILTGVRRFSQELRPSVLDDLGLITAIKWLISDFNKNYSIAVEIEIRGNQPQFSPEVEVMLFRIIQEALTNVRKHSEATHVLISLDFTEHKVKLLIRDNGKGFEMPSKVENFAKEGKLGLVGIQERVKLLGGVMSIESQHGKGTSFAIEVPL